jgi:hypothetical protein
MPARAFCTRQILSVWSDCKKAGRAPGKGPDARLAVASVLIAQALLVSVTLLASTKTARQNA